MSSVVASFLCLFGFAAGCALGWFAALARASGTIAALEERARLAADSQTLANSMKVMATEALQQNSKAFIESAKSVLEQVQQGAAAALDRRNSQMNETLAPVKVALEKVEGQIKALETARAGAYSGLIQQIESLHRQTNTLATALRAPAVRGQWGEMQLRRIVEMAGMQNHCDFEEQVSLRDSDGVALRPDLIVRLAGGKNIVVDAKTPLSAYMDATEAHEDSARQEHLTRFARHVREHVRQLGSKSYWDKLPGTPELVVLFLPGEHFFSEALVRDPALVEYGAENNVFLAAPTTLLVLLKAVGYGWRQEQLADNAREISDLGKELYERLASFGGHLAGLGKALAGGINHYNRAVGVLESRVLVSARRFRDLGTVANESADITELEPVETQPRQLMTAEGGQTE